MNQDAYDYVIVGGGLAGASAAAGIREIDKTGTILIIGSETERPYNRPPLSKQLWFGKKTIEQIFVEEPEFYADQKIALALGTTATSLDCEKKEIRDGSGDTFRYHKLLLATGGTPRRLAIPGGSLSGICYYRALDDYRRIRALAHEGRRALVIGGGFIGSEMAAALSSNKIAVSMLFPGRYLVSRVFPQDLGQALQRVYVERGVKVVAEDRPARIEQKNGGFVTHTERGQAIESDILLAGIGIAPNIELAQAAGLSTGNGIIVNESLQTSNPDVYAAGDNAYFHLYGLEQHTRIEHWDNAMAQGRTAGRNMAGAGERYEYMPYFFSDLFEFGYEAVGEISSELETYADWETKYETGAVYYLKANRVRGVMLCNIWERVDEARALIKSGKKLGSPSELRGRISTFKRTA